MHLRFSIVLLIPSSSGLVGLHGALLVSKLHLKQLRNILLPRCRPPEVALQRVVVDRRVEAAGGVFGIRLSVRLEGLGERVGGVVGLVQVGLLDCGGALERQAGFLACTMLLSAGARGPVGARLTLLLHSEGVRGLDVQLRSILVLLLTAAEQAEA